MCNLDFWPRTLQILELCFPLKASSCTGVARCLWLGEAEHSSLTACLLLPLGTRVDAGIMVLVVRLGSLKAILDQPLVWDHKLSCFVADPYPGFRSEFITLSCAS